MSWVDEYLKEKQQRDYGVDNSMVKEPSPDYAQIQSQMQTPDVSGSGYQAPSGGQTGMNVATAGMAGGAVGGPMGAGIAAAGALATQYLAEKAAAERAKRDRAAQIEQQYAQNQNTGYQTFFNAIQGAYK